MYRTIRISRRLFVTTAAVFVLSLLLSFVSASIRLPKGYTRLYPGLYVSAEEDEKQGDTPDTVQIKKAYLTFDDGPSGVTPRILDVLDELGVKATFFVIGRNSEADVETLRRIHEEGHTIGLHSYSHEYQKIYHSVEDYLADFQALEQWVFEITGERAEIFRFPGGSNNSTAKKSVMTAIAEEMTRRGYTYYDWNVIAHDDKKAAYSPEVLFQNVKASAKGKLDRDLILLFHDNATRKTTPDVLPQVVEYFRENGYEFDQITSDTRPIQFQKPKK